MPLFFLPLLLAVPGLVLVRTGAVPARILAWLAMLTLALAALDPPAVRWREQPADVVAVCTAGGELADRVQAVLARAAAAPAMHVTIVPSAADRFATALAGSLARGGPSAAEHLAVWTGPLPTGDLPCRGGFDVRTAAPVWPFDPESVFAVPRGNLATGRPVALEVGCAGLPATVAGRRRGAAERHRTATRRHVQRAMDTDARGRLRRGGEPRRRRCERASSR
jgi:hypothetical protein